MEGEESPCRIGARIATVSLEDYIWWVSTGHGDSNKKKKKRHCSWWCAVCGGKCEWRAPNRILVVQLGTNEDEALVFREHAVLQGLCENLINASQQRDGDSPIHNIVTGLLEKWRRYCERLEKLD